MEDVIEIMYDEIKKEVTHLSIRWHVFHQMFTRENEWKLINDNIPKTGWVILGAFYDTVYMQICRITDKIQGTKLKNLSMGKLLHEIEKEHGSQPSLQNTINKLYILSEGIHTWRDKFIGHRDLDSIIQDGKPKLPPVIRRDVDEIVKLIQKVMNEIELSINKDPVSYNIIDHLSDADHLFYLLQAGVGATS